jgi:hypothetical protein
LFGDQFLTIKQQNTTLVVCATNLPNKRQQQKTAILNRMFRMAAFLAGVVVCSQDKGKG